MVRAAGTDRTHPLAHAEAKRPGATTRTQPPVSVSATRPTPKPPPVYKPAAQSRAGHAPQQQPSQASAARPTRTPPAAQQKRALPTQAHAESKRVAAFGAEARVVAKHGRATPRPPSATERPLSNATVQRLRATPANAARPDAAASRKGPPSTPSSSPRPAPVAAPSPRPGVIQRSASSAEPKFSGVHVGAATSDEKKSGYATFAQVNFTPTQSVTTQSSTPSMTFQELMGEDLVDDEHTHAEDKVMTLIPQQWLMLKRPSTPIPFDLYITSSPCSSTYGTSSKSEGCAETMLRLYKEGVPITHEESGHKFYIKFQIGTLTVKKLYRPRVKDARDKSLAALVELRKAGVCKKVVVEGPKPMTF